MYAASILSSRQNNSHAIVKREQEPIDVELFQYYEQVVRHFNKVSEILAQTSKCGDLDCLYKNQLYIVITKSKYAPLYIIKKIEVRSNAHQYHYLYDTDVAANFFTELEHEVMQKQKMGVLVHAKHISNSLKLLLKKRNYQLSSCANEYLKTKF